MSTALLDVLDAASVLNMSTRHVHNLVRAGQLPHVAFPNGEVRFDLDDLRQWIESRKRPVAEEGQP